MKITEVLDKEAIVLDLQSTDKKGIIEEMVMPLADLSGIKFQDLSRVLMERERLGSTGIGGGIGIPHGKCKSLNSLLIGVGINRKGVDFNAIDGQPTYIFFVLITPENSIDIHLKMLSRISRLLKSEFFKEKLLNAKSREDIYSIIEQEDENN